VMSRVPRPGRTKTRLMPPISAQECADFHRAVLRDTCKLIYQSGMDGFIYYADEHDDRHESIFCPSDSIWALRDPEARFMKMRPQRGIDLGERMQNAAEELLSDYDAVILVGSDSPTLSIHQLSQIPDYLLKHDLVIGPAEDGGYYLLALKKVYQDLFEGISWGSSTVLATTLARADALNLSYELLEPLTDIDTWQDLMYFVKTGEDSGGLFTYLESFHYARYLLIKYS
jgi:rSAM/selenodomain-associated transferase 1